MLVSRLIGGANTSALSPNAQIGPLMDALGAFTYGGTTPPDRVSAISATARSNNIKVKWTVTRDEDDKKAFGYMILASKDRDLLNDGLNFRDLPEEVVSMTVTTGDLNVGDAIEGTISDLDFETEYHVAVVGYDYNSNYSGLSPVKSVQTLGNNPPVIRTEYDGDWQIRSHETVDVEFEIYDPDGHKFNISLTPGSKALTGSSNAVTGKYVLRFVGNADEPGEYQAKLTATDSYGLSATETVTYRILENHPPQIIKDIDDMILTAMGERFTIDMSEHLSDPDGEQLRYQVNISDRNVLHINPSDNILHGTALNFGQSDVSIVASDSRDETCTLAFKVLVMDPSAAVSAYPNPVTDVLNIRTGEEAETYIRVTSSSGATIYEKTSVVGAFSPASIDMGGCSPGRYVVLIRCGGKEYTKTVTKI